MRARAIIREDVISEYQGEPFKDEVSFCISKKRGELEKIPLLKDEQIKKTEIEILEKSRRRK